MKDKFKKLLPILLTLGGLVVIFWILEIFDQLFFNGSLDLYGIRPRTVVGLKGIVFAPFLHGGFQHLISNTVPFVVLGLFVASSGLADFLIVFGMSAIIGGLGTWCVGSANSIHIGASSVVFGFLGFMLFLGFFKRSGLSIFLSIVVAVLYGSIIWGALPGQMGISWEGHLFGLIGGILAARIMYKKKKAKYQSDF